MGTNTIRKDKLIQNDLKPVKCAQENTEIFKDLFRERRKKSRLGQGLRILMYHKTEEGKKTEPPSFSFASVLIQENNLQTGKSRIDITKMDLEPVMN